MIEYKINILYALKEKGYTSYKLRKDGILSESTISKLRQNKMISLKELDKICNLLSVDLFDLITYKQSNV